MEVIACGMHRAGVVHGLLALPDDLRRALIDFLRRSDRLTSNSLAHLLHPAHQRTTWDELDLSGCTKLSPKGIKGLGDLPNLTALNLSATSLQPAAIKEVAALVGLRRLCLDNSWWVEDTCLEQVATLRSLESLSLVACPCTPHGLKSLSRLTTLRSLNLSQAGKAAASGPQAVLRRSMQPPGLRFRDPSLRFLTRLTRLEHLNVAGMGTDGSFLINLNPATLRELTFGLPSNGYTARLPDARLSKLTSLTHLSIRPCSDTVFGPSRLRTLSRLVDLRLPMVVFAAPVFAELLEELPLLRRLSVSISVLLLRRVESDEPAIECYPDATAFPPDLAWLTFNWGTDVPPPALARQTTTTTTTTRTLMTRRQATATTPAPTVSAFQSDPLTASTLERLAELLSASSPRLGVLKFKGDYPPDMLSLLKASPLMQLSSLHTLQHGSEANLLT